MWLVEQTSLAPSLIDAYFATAEKRIPFEDFQTYKVIIDIDGNGWSGRFEISQTALHELGYSEDSSTFS